MRHDAFGWQIVRRSMALAELARQTDAWLRKAMAPKAQALWHRTPARSPIRVGGVGLAMSRLWPAMTSHPRLEQGG
jgi:hypothetical protein